MNIALIFLELKIHVITKFSALCKSIIYLWMISKKCHPVQCVLDEVLPLDRFIGLLICSSKLSYPHLHLRILLFRLRWENTFLEKRNWHKIAFCSRIYQRYLLDYKGNHLFRIDCMNCIRLWDNMIERYWNKYWNAQKFSIVNIYFLDFIKCIWCYLTKWE